MPPPNFAAINGNPALLLTWLQTNLLMAGNITDVPNPPGTASVGIIAPPAIPAPAAAVDHYTGAAMDTWVANCAGAAPNALPSYVCNYQPGQVRSVTLAAAANFCFTVTLNGCTFGIGPVAPGGVRVVSHANTGGNTLPQRAQTWAEHHVPANAQAITMLEPMLYRKIAPAMQATVFGIRVGGNWQFHFQSYDRLPGAGIRVYGVFPILLYN